MEKNNYRVAQWATGNIGSRSLRAIIEHPHMTLVGVWVSGAEKAGKDAGELAGTDPTGITATQSIDDILAARPDCVLYMRQGTDLDELCTLLEAGVNVVTTRGDFHHPPTMDPAARSRIEAACTKGGTSIHSTGSSPGFVTEALTIPLLSLSRRHDCLTIEEYADMASRNSPQLMFQIMGFGAPVGEFDQGKIAYVKHDFAGSLGQIADAIGLPCDDFEATGELAAARNTVEIAAGTIEAGSVGAMRITVTGLRGGKPIVRFRANWYCTDDIDVDWGLRESGWRIRTEGDTPVSLDIHFPVSAEEYPLFTPGLTAHRAVNAVPALCKAAPGIRTTVDLPQVIAQF
ncbi:NAD(P)H-dependent amine dehydrogenase family protein [Stakelama tenebrarum]|uniref:Dihydrodipicolinate reductase n=1 Tax=Stakelama tenebrarum TaxID=2711215 RepID=A0A6G6Y7C8_9SPHN|nr:dihydrodipicolinate reductase [Sphingosinithalassobacter tenebrarum]QIG80820.1 dihydrodipicolinate reductase [Sphingosinithalassobacter tenebrarum]